MLTYSLCHVLLQCFDNDPYSSCETMFQIHLFLLSVVSLRRLIWIYTAYINTGISVKQGNKVSMDSRFIGNGPVQRV